MDLPLELGWWSDLFDGCSFVPLSSSQTTLLLQNRTSTITAHAGDMTAF